MALDCEAECMPTLIQGISSMRIFSKASWQAQEVPLPFLKAFLTDLQKAFAQVFAVIRKNALVLKSHGLVFLPQNKHV